MLRFSKPFALLSVLAIAGCSDPLAEFDQYSDLNISDETRPVAALPDAAQSDGPIGPLAELAAVDADGAPDPTITTAVDAALADIDKKAEARAARGGLLGWLRRQAEEADADVADTEVADAAAPEDLTVTADAVPDAAPEQVETEELAAEEIASEDATPTEISQEAAQAASADESKTNGAEDAPVEVASLSPEPLIEAAAEPQKKPKRRGLFGAAPKKYKASEGTAADVSFGTVLPFGEIGRVCEARSKPLGTRVEKSETRGQTYSLYDSAPSGAGPRTFYVTGFADKCPRQFTAAMAMFGAPSMHEQLRYGKPSETYPYSDTDRAYERLKKRLCGVGPKKPCGSKIEFLERDTVFISTYENFSGSGRWADVLIHNSAVLASAIKKVGG